MMQGETVLSGGEHPGTELEVMESPAGWDLGCRDKDGMQYSRETQYLYTQHQAQIVLDIIRK